MFHTSKTAKMLKDILLSSMLTFWQCALSNITVIIFAINRLGVWPPEMPEKSQKVSDSHRNDVSPLTQGLCYRAACDKQLPLIFSINVKWRCHWRHYNSLGRQWQIFEWKQEDRGSQAKSVVLVAAVWPETNLHIVYIDTDQSLALFLGRSLKSATQVSRLNLTTQYFLAIKNGWVETQVLSGT